jgi:o-succinylbenzoate synthase
MYALSFSPYTLQFKFEAGTSRGVMTQHHIYLLHLHYKNTLVGQGEIAPLPQLSKDAAIPYNDLLTQLCHHFNQQKITIAYYTTVDEWVSALLATLPYEPTALPALLFALEMVWLGWKNGSPDKLYDNSFYDQSTPLPINGLVWMGKKEMMQEQISAKLAEGYRCIKLKIGAIHFEDELALLAGIREQFSKEQIVLRVDANGAFSPTEAHQKLLRLAAYDLHSIEQPIRQGQWQAMRLLCEDTPLPIALDEELIGIQGLANKRALLMQIRPQFIILKPTLLGGLRACDEWIALAEELGIGWWTTSALESNVGLNAICQYTAHKIMGTAWQDFPQGLGTGQLYENNLPSPLRVHGGYIRREKIL